MTVRSGPRVERHNADSLQAALALAEERARDLAATTDVEPVDTRMRTFTPAEQVAHRIEISGPGRVLPSVRAGIDVRGDGSLEAFTGRTRRQLVEPAPPEDVFAALCRTVGA